MVIPATTALRWRKIQSLAQRYDNVFATYGLHPMFCNEHRQDHLQSLRQLLPEGVAIGECGLDKQKHTTDLDRQARFFAAQIELAQESLLPLIIHARGAIEQVILMLKEAALGRNNGNGVVHSFNGSLPQAYRLIDLNFRLSFGGPVTFSNARKLHELINRLPQDSIMLETDAPDQSAELHRGKRNEPQWLIEVARAVAKRRGETLEDVVAGCNRNAVTLFNLPEELLS